MVNKIKDNTISEIDAKKRFKCIKRNKKKQIIKYKKCTPGHKKLLNLFNKLLNILIHKTSESQENEKAEKKKMKIMKMNTKMNMKMKMKIMNMKMKLKIINMKMKMKQ